MANLRAKDADSTTKFLKASGAGTDTDPLVVEHADTAVLAKLVDALTLLGQLLIELKLKGNIDQVQPIGGIVSVANFPATQPVSGSVSVANFPATQPVSGSVSVANLPNLQAISDYQTTYTETAIALGATQSFVGSGRDGFNRNTVRGWVWVNVNGTLYIEQSKDNVTWRQTDSIAIIGNSVQATPFLFRLLARYYRLRYVNGNTTQSSFEIISTTFGIGL